MERLPKDILAAKLFLDIGRHFSTGIKSSENRPTRRKTANNNLYSVAISTTEVQQTQSNKKVVRDIDLVEKDDLSNVSYYWRISNDGEVIYSGPDTKGLERRLLLEDDDDRRKLRFAIGQLALTDFDTVVRPRIGSKNQDTSS